MTLFNKYIKQILESINSEYWDTGSLLVDCHLSDYTHESYVFNELCGEYDIENLKTMVIGFDEYRNYYESEFSNEEEKNNVADNLINDYGLDPDGEAKNGDAVKSLYEHINSINNIERKILRTERGAREYAIEHWGWIRISGYSFEVWNIDSSILKKIKDDIVELDYSVRNAEEQNVGDELMQDVEVSCLSNNRYFSIPYNELDSVINNLSELAKYRG